MIFITSRGIDKISGLSAMLGQAAILHRPWHGRNAIAVAGWGLKPSALKARHLAQKLGVPYWSLEDGFVRSLAFGSDAQRLSIAIDEVGIYYDARHASRLENLIADKLSAKELQRAQHVQAAWCQADISKYNHARNFTGTLPKQYVLVADQTQGDASVEYGLSNSDSFARMLECALRENPAAKVIVKIHPDVVSGRKRGYFDCAELAKNPRIQLISNDVHPTRLIREAQTIYAVTSQIGFEGLLWHKPVRTFGMPFYAGWGLTQDELQAPARRQPVALDQLVHAALIAYPRYLDPESGERCEVERVIEWMGLQRRHMERFPAEIWALGFSAWKRPVLQDFFRGSRVHFVSDSDVVPPGATVVVWGLKIAPAYCKVIRLEDGFLRSVGLGADLIRPLSWVQDGQGIYYDARQPSWLEQLLNQTNFDDSLLQRAAQLRQRIQSSGLTKYNIGIKRWQRPADMPQDRLVILVPGQVESDASLTHGTGGLCRNIDLLQAVRQAHPHAYILYKPHPDVVAGLRQVGTGESGAAAWCDEIVEDCSIGALFESVDAVHVMTSLAGFEALLRNKTVVTYGQPFYAGWGLTEDKHPPPRRSRHLSLDALVAACLILYPTYISLITRCFTTPEQALLELHAWHAREGGAYSLRTRLKRIVLRRVVGVR